MVASRCRKLVCMKSFKRLSRLMLNTQKGREKDRDRDCKLTPMAGLAQDSHNMTRGMQELQDMASRYEGLVTVSAQLAASAYEFSGAVQNLGSYCVKHFGSMENDDIGKIFETVGRVQLEISKSLDLYGSHVSQTIVTPTESLLSELRHLEDAKRQYEAKRQVLDEVRCNIIKGKNRNPEGEDHMETQMRQVNEECEQLAVFIGCRLLSLEHGRPRSLITQAARHYTAQVQLFGTVLEVLQGIDRYMKSVMQERNIDKRLNSTANAVSIVDNHVILDSNTNLPARLTNLKNAAAKSSVHGETVTVVSDNQGSCDDRGGFVDNSEDKQGVEKDVALCLQQDNIAKASAPTSPARCEADATLDDASSAFGPPCRRPPTVLHIDHVLVCPLPSSASVSCMGDMPSDSHDESPSVGVGGKLMRSPPGNKEGRATSFLSPNGHRKDAARTTVGTTSLHHPVVGVGVPSFSYSGAAGVRSELSSSRPWPAEAGASRRYSQAGPEPAPSRRYSQSGPLTFTGTPWPSATQGTSGAATPGKDPTPFAGAAAARSPRVTKLQISELHKLPAPPRGTTTAATSPPAPSPASVGSARSGPLVKSHVDCGTTRARTSAQQQLLAAAGVQGRSPVSRSLSLPSSTQNVRKYGCSQSEDQLVVTRKLSRIARKENLPSRAAR